MREFTRAGCWLVAGIIGVLLIIGVAVGLEAAGLTWYEPWRRNKETEIIRNTNQYVTTAQEQIADAWRRYNDPSATDGQRNAAVDDMCRAANRIDDQYVQPNAAKEVMRQRGCWDDGRK